MIKKKSKNSYEVYTTELAGSTQNPKKLSEHQINQSGRIFSHLKSGKEPNIRMGVSTEFAEST
jgi:hypothetical protein